MIDVTHVINHTIPEDEKAYLHRVGRTGRAGRNGTAVTFVDWDDLHKWTLIDKALEFGQPEPVETYSSSPHLYTDLDIPADAKGRLASAGPKADRPPRDGASGSRPRSEQGSTGRQRSRTRGQGERPEAASGDNVAQGAHDGGGSEHHDGNSAPRRRNRHRRRTSGGGSSAGGAPTA